MKKIAVFPGSFDPFTVGHESVVVRALSLFDTIIIGVGSNVGKDPFFPVEKRVQMISQVFQKEDRVLVMSFPDLTIDFCKRVKATHMLRGLRTSADFEYEKAIAQVNQVMLPEVESVFMLTLPEHVSINSSVVREILRFGGDVSQFVPAGMLEKI